MSDDERVIVGASARRAPADGFQVIVKRPELLLPSHRFNLVSEDDQALGLAALAGFEDYGEGARSYVVKSGRL